MTRIAELREMVRDVINLRQDIVSWQPGESRNALVCDIRDAVDRLFALAEANDANS